MPRPAATVVILAWNAWDETQTCLASLRPTLGPGDQVVVVDNGSVDETASALAGYDWVEVLTNPENRGFAAGCNQGAAAARNDVLVFLNNDTAVTTNWLDDLLEPFVDPTVSATGPRSNFVSGLQLIDVAYRVDNLLELQDFAWLWRLAHRGQRRSTTRLVGFCLAVRTVAFHAVGGFDEGFGIGGCEDDDLCLKLIADGGRLLVVDEVFIHHDGHATFDANELDWFAIQTKNLERLQERHHNAAPALPWPDPLPEREPVAGDPRVSVLVPTHARPDLLRRALQSIADQTYRDIEAVVVNDGGPDVTGVVDAFRGRLAITLVTHPVNRGRAGACNSAVLAARGELLCFLDDDDRYFPHHVSTLVEAYDRRRTETPDETVGVYSFCIRVAESEGTVQRVVLGDAAFDADTLAVTNTIVGMTPVVPASALRAAGGFDERMRVLEDWELWLRLTSLGLRFSPVPVPTAEYHWHATNQTVRELNRFHAGVLHTYAQHPVPPASMVALHRQQFVASSEARQEAYAFDVSVVVAGHGDLHGLVTTLQSAARTVAGGRWELIVCVPAVDDYEPLLRQLDGDYTAYATKGLTVEEIWTLAEQRAAGRYRMLVREGDTVDAEEVAVLLAGPVGSAAEVGTHRPPRIAPSPVVPGPRSGVTDTAPV